MRRYSATVHTAASLAATGQFAQLASRLGQHLWSDSRRIVLRRDLRQPFERPRSPVGFSIRLLEPSDVDTLFDVDSADEHVEREKRQRWLRAGMTSCYVAALRDGRAVFMQWLCTPSDNEVLRAVFPFEDLVVEPDTILLEGAYTPSRFRRLPLIPAAMAQIAERGRDLDARWAVVCVDEKNTSMIRASEWAGFTPWRLTTIRRRLFVPRFHYAAAPASLAPRGAAAREAPTRRARRGRRRA